MIDRDDLNRKLSRIEKDSKTSKSLIEIVTLFNKALFKLIKTDKIAIAIIEGTILRSIDTIGKRVFMDLSLNQPSINIRTIKSKKTQNITDTRLDPDYFPGQVNDSFEIRSELCVPVIYEGKVLGTINLESTNIANYSVRDAQIVEKYARILAKATHNYLTREGISKLDQRQQIRPNLDTSKRLEIEEWYETLTETEFKEKVIGMILDKVREKC